MAIGSLGDIRRKVRLLTARPSSGQITDKQIDFYINAFYIHDFPETLRVFSTIGTFKVTLEANVGKYSMLIQDIGEKKFNELGVYSNGEYQAAAEVFYNLSPPAFVEGSYVNFSQDFVGSINDNSRTEQVAYGDGSKGPYEMQLTGFPVEQESLAASALTINDDSTMRLHDVPFSRKTGEILMAGDNGGGVYGNINYLDGNLSLTFPSSVATGKEIRISYAPYVASKPSSVIFNENNLIFYQIPDKAYEFSIKANIVPTKLLSSESHTKLGFWWQYIAYGAAKKVFEDNGDAEGVQRIMPAFKEQESLVISRHASQRNKTRTPTLFSGVLEGDYFSRWTSGI